MATPRARPIRDPRLGDAAVLGGATAVWAVLSVVVLNEFVADGTSHAAVAVGVGVLVCLVLVLTRSHPYRGLGIYVWLGFATLAATGIWAYGGTVGRGPWQVVLAGSVIGIFAAAHYARAVRRAGAALWNPMRPVSPAPATFAGGILTAFAFALAVVSFCWPISASDALRHRPFGLAACGGAFAYLGYAVIRLFRPAFEWFLSAGYAVLYRGRGYGPGVVGCPPVGPVLVVANHAAIFDPIAIQKACLRPVIGMMSSLYYDLPGLHVMARHIFKTIRVPHGFVRREAPELKEAVAALDRGECVLIFPEGWLRRKDDVPLRRFAQGVWQILRDRPDTPVIACWVEGMWGSFFSHKGGPIGTNKRFDFRRRVDVGVSAAMPVPAEVLADQWATRFYLMNAVTDARRHLGLEPLPRFERGTAESDE